MAGKFDGVIEAVRYKNGLILVARAYERRGAAFSDRVLLDRKTLVERLQQGKMYRTGERLLLRGGTFKVGPQVHLVGRDGREWIATREHATRDELEGIPVF